MHSEILNAVLAAQPEQQGSPIQPCPMAGPRPVLERVPQGNSVESLASFLKGNRALAVCGSGGGAMFRKRQQSQP